MIHTSKIIIESMVTDSVRMKSTTCITTATSNNFSRPNFESESDSPNLIILNIYSDSYMSHRPQCRSRSTITIESTKNLIILVDQLQLLINSVVRLH